MTIETKITKNGNLSLKHNGRRERYDRVKHDAYFWGVRGEEIIIKNDKGKTFTGRKVNDKYTFANDNEEIYIFDSTEEAINRIATETFRPENYTMKIA